MTKCKQPKNFDLYHRFTNTIHLSLYTFLSKSYTSKNFHLKDYMII